jgi:hypothetical protein
MVRPPRPRGTYDLAVADPAQLDLFSVGRPTLEALGLAPGDHVRYRPGAARRWQEGVVRRREKDGSVGLQDGDGRFRALPPERLERRTAGPRGGVRWVPVLGTARAG